MKNFYPLTTFKNVLFATGTLPVVMAALIQVPVAAQVAPETVIPVKDTTQIAKDSTADSSTSTVITSFIDFNLPPEMVMHFMKMSVREVINMDEEFQVTQNDENGQPEIITVKLWFDSDHIKGYVMYAPLEKTDQVTESKLTVNIPVEWVCTPPNPTHIQHVVKTINEMRQIAATNKCSGWHLRLPPFPPPVPKVKPVKQKAERAHKGKKGGKKPITPNTAPPATDSTNTIPIPILKDSASGVNAASQ